MAKTFVFKWIQSGEKWAQNTAMIMREWTHCFDISSSQSDTRQARYKGSDKVECRGFIYPSNYEIENTILSKTRNYQNGAV